MQKYIQTVDNLINECDRLTAQILSEELHPDAMNLFVSHMTDFLRMLSEVYAMEEFAAHADDVPAWIGQTQRLVNALSGGDVFFLLDVISYEIKSNLQEVAQILGGAS